MHKCKCKIVKFWGCWWKWLSMFWSSIWIQSRQFSHLFVQNVAFFMKLAYIQVLIKRRMREARIKADWHFASSGGHKSFVKNNIFVGGCWQLKKKILVGKEFKWIFGKLYSLFIMLSALCVARGTISSFPSSLLHNDKLLVVVGDSLHCSGINSLSFPWQVTDIDYGLIN